ncbi:hypothetical protein E7744_11350 [Citricoccus sp. SGAir0253]|uniref:hypothetical protein n=1 Tax=Citricoccus sp. SGAir0253 TaxID=2567881 RepID=UPI0010CCDEB8|nr:hypothetical protein [Citricoccus sp. SGAir0253]QCU78676.1 hypothetical protein E7744_11350 [Citricoccus sp. SGAir0253]
MSSHQPRAIQPPLLALVEPLPNQSLEHRIRDLLHTLNAAGITATHDQAQALVEHGMTGLGCWTPSRALRDLDQAASQHFSIARRAQPAAAQTTARDIRKETTR